MKYTENLDNDLNEILENDIQFVDNCIDIIHGRTKPLNGYNDYFSISDGYGNSWEIYFFEANDIVNKFLIKETFNFFHREKNIDNTQLLIVDKFKKDKLLQDNVFVSNIKKALNDKTLGNNGILNIIDKEENEHKIQRWVLEKLIKYI